MYRTESHKTAAQPFSGLAEAQEAHIALVGQVDGLAPAERLRGPAAYDAMARIARIRRAIRAFEWRLAASGALIVDPQQRALAQSLLDFWSLRQVELRDRTARLAALAEHKHREGPRNPIPRRAVSPRTLLPVDEGLARSLAETAESTYFALASDAQRDHARSLFLAIASPYASDWQVDTAVAAEFAAAGVIVSSGGGSAMRYALAHDSVAREWPRLVGWMATSREDDHLRELVRANAANWEETEVADALPLGAALEQAERFAASDPLIARYVEAAYAAAAERKRFNRKVISAVVALSIAVAIALVVGPLLLRPPSIDYSEHLKKDAADFKTAEVTKDLGELVAARASDPAQNLVAVSTEVAASASCPRGDDPSGYLWIGSLGNTQVFDAKGKPVEPDGVREGMTLSLRAWFNLRKSKPPDDGQNIAGNVIGTASARSLVVARANPERVTVKGTEQYWLAVSLPQSVYIQVPDSGAGPVGALIGRLKEQNLQVPPVQLLAMPPGLNEVRYYYNQDARRAEQVACLANEVLAPTPQNRIEVRSLADTSLAAKVNNGTIELWLFPRGERSAQPPQRGGVRPARPAAQERGGIK